jgi:hypothetical protein
MGYQPTKRHLHRDVEEDVKGITAFRLEMLHDPNLPASVRNGSRSIHGCTSTRSVSLDHLR